MAAKPKDVDWERVEGDYRAGALSDRAIGKKYGITHGAVQQRAKREGWAKDLAARIEKRREEKLAKAILAKQGSQSISLATEKEVVEANADAQSGLILRHQEEIASFKVVILEMIAELRTLTNRDLREALEVVLDEECVGRSQKAQDRLRKAFYAALSIAGRSGSARNLVGSFVPLIDKERQAGGIDKADTSRKSVGEELEDLAKAA